MKNTVEAWVIKDPEGNVWKTSKGKSSWVSKGTAKNAWGYHRYKNYRNMKWSEDAEPIGRTVEQIAKY